MAEPLTVRPLLPQDMEWIAELTRQEREGIDKSTLPARTGEENDYDWDAPQVPEISERARKISAGLRRP